jgi:hypothetical protein
MIGGDRPQYINEMLIDEVSKKKMYQDANIKKNLETYFQLAFRNNKETNEMLKKYYESYIDLLKADIEGKIEKFKAGQLNFAEAAKVNVDNNNNKDTIKNAPRTIQGMYDNATMMNNPYMYGNINNMSSMNSIASYGGDYKQQDGGEYPYDMMNPTMSGLDYGYGTSSPYGYNMGMPMSMVQGMNNMRKQPPVGATDYVKYKKNSDRIEALQKKLDERDDSIELNEAHQKEENEANKKTIKKIAELNKENNAIIAKIKKGLFETALIHGLRKDLKRVDLTPKEKIQLEKLEDFFEDIIQDENYDKDTIEKKNKECHGNIYQCFQEEYKNSKAIVEKERLKYNDIISLIVKWIDKNPYTDSNFVQYLNRLRRLILAKKDFDIVNDNDESEDIEEGKKPVETGIQTETVQQPVIAADENNNGLVNDINNTNKQIDNTQFQSNEKQNTSQSPQPTLVIDHRSTPTSGIYPPNMQPLGYQMVPQQPYTTQTGQPYNPLKSQNLPNNALKEVESPKEEKLPEERKEEQQVAEERKEEQQQIKGPEEEKLSEELKKGEQQNEERKEEQQKKEQNEVPQLPESQEETIRLKKQRLITEINNLQTNDNEKFKMLKELLESTELTNLTQDIFKNILKIQLKQETKTLYLDILNYIIKNNKDKDKDTITKIINNKTLYKDTLKYNVKLLIQAAEQNDIDISADIITLLLTNSIYYNIEQMKNKSDDINILDFELKDYNNSDCSTCDFIYNPKYNKNISNENRKNEKYTDKIYLDYKLNIFNSLTRKRFILSFYRIIKYNDNILKKTINNELILILAAIFYLTNRHYLNDKQSNEFKIEFKKKDKRRNKYKNKLEENLLIILEEDFFKDININTTFKNYINASQINPNLKKFIIDKLENKQQGGANEQVPGNNVPNTLTNEAKIDESKYETYNETVQTWLDKYEEMAENYTNKFAANFDTKINGYRKLILENISELDVFITEINKDNYKLSQLKTTINTIKEQFKDFDTSYTTKDFNTFLDNFVNLDNTVVDKIKNDKTLKMLFKEKEFDIFKTNTITEHKRAITSIKEQLANVSSFLKYNDIKRLSQNLENISSNLGKILQEDDTKIKIRNNEYKDSALSIAGESLSKLKNLNNEIKNLANPFNFINYIANASGKYKNLDKTTEIISKLDKLKNNIKHRNKTAINKVLDNSNQDGELAGQYNSPSIYQRLWNRYIEDVNDSDKLLEDSQDKLYTGYKGNNLDPNIALALTKEDKVLFILIVFVIRQIVLSIVDILIDKDIITSLFMSLICYIGIYIGFLLLIVLIVNIDDYKLRIMFNYFNLHVNSNGISLHIILIIGFTLIMYFLIYNMNRNLDNPEKNILTEVEKLRLTYKIELMTIAVFVFVAASDLILS